MAERRMFAKTIALSDAFLDMPMSARCLYFTLGMVADDDGFVNSPRAVMRQCGASDDDMKILVAKKFVLLFESGIIVIKHWRVNNYLRTDRYVETKYTEEKAKIAADEKGIYRLVGDGIPPGIPSIGKDSIVKCSVGQSSIVKGECEGENPPAEEAGDAAGEIDDRPIDKNAVKRYAELIRNRRAAGQNDSVLYRIAEMNGITRAQIDAALEEKKGCDDGSAV